MTTHMELKTATHLSDQEMEKIYRIRQRLYWEMDFISRCRERKKEGIGLCNLPYQTLSEEKKLLDLAYELYNDMEDSNTAYNVTLDLVIDEIEKYIKDNPYRLAVRKACPGFFRKVRDFEIEGERYNAYGNLFHLRNPFKSAVIVNRKDTDEEFARKQEDWLGSVIEGGVLVSPFI